VAVRHLGGDQFAGQGGPVRVTFLLGQVSLEDGVRRPLSEVRFEHGRQGQPTTGPPAANAVSPRRHRSGR
jgi:hypothetical protein